MESIAPPSVVSESEGHDDSETSFELIVSRELHHNRTGTTPKSIESTLTSGTIMESIAPPSVVSESEGHDDSETSFELIVSRELHQNNNDEEKKDEDDTMSSQNIWRSTKSLDDQSGQSRERDEEEGGDKGNSSAPITGTPGFRCVVFVPGKSMSKIKANPSNGTLDTVAEESAANQQQSGGGIGVALMINEEGTENEVWVVDQIKLHSPLVDSPVERGDIVVRINGKTNFQEAIDEIRTDPDRLISIVLCNPHPEAQFDLVETWIHPSAYHSKSPLEEEHTDGMEDANDSLGLVLNSDMLNEGYLEVAEPPTGVWEHTLLDTHDVVVAVHRLSAEHVTYERVTNMLLNDRSTNRTISIHTRIRSATGMELAKGMEEDVGSYIAKAVYVGPSYVSLGSMNRFVTDFSVLSLTKNVLFSCSFADVSQCLQDVLFWLSSFS